MKPSLDTGALAHAVLDAIVESTCQLRGNRDAAQLLDAGPELYDAVLNADGFGLSSLELLSAATDAADRFDLRRHGIEDYLLRRRTVAQWAELIARFVDETTQITFFSSGSTGEPAKISHALMHLFEEADALSERLDGVQRVRLFVPPRHIYGFIWGVVFPTLRGIPVLPAGGAPTPLAPGDLIVSYPDHWAFLAAGDTPLPPDLRGISATAPLAPGVAAGLRARGLRTLIEIYGSSQTAGVGWRDEHMGPYQLFAHWRDLPVASTGASSLRRRDGVEAPIQDHLERLDARRFHVRGRLDEAVQVSGMNVYPRRVQSVLERSELVASARVRLDQATGGLAALIVPRDPGALSEDRRPAVEREVSAFCRHRLAPFECPQRFHFVAEIPRGAMGKEIAWT